jgi:hypothetical protein
MFSVEERSQLCQLASYVACICRINPIGHDGFMILFLTENVLNDHSVLESWIAWFYSIVTLYTYEEGNATPLN